MPSVVHDMVSKRINIRRDVEFIQVRLVMNEY